MRNFNDVVSALADELDDTNDEYTAQIHKAIYAALRFCAREPFYFNEARPIVFDTIAGQAWYEVKDVANIASLKAVMCQRASGGLVWQLQYETAARLEVLDGARTPGSPQKFCYFGQKLRLYPRPEDNGYQIRLFVTAKGFEEINNPNADNIWFVEACDLIFARAKYELYKNILKDGVAAAAALADFHEQLQILQVETSRRRAGGCIEAMLF